MLAFEFLKTELKIDLKKSSNLNLKQVLKFQGLKLDLKRTQTRIFGRGRTPG
jgi:hypothetical protein